MIVSLLLALAGAASAFDLTIVHTNDVHGWIMARPAKDDPSRRAGGAASLAAFYKKQPAPRLLVDAGDWFQGTPEGTLSKGEASVKVFNAVPYDLVVPGNHDFDESEARLKQLVAMLEMPVLAANIYDKKTGKRVPYTTPWLVKEIEGVKVGFYGLVTTNMRNLTYPENFEGLDFRGEVEIAREAVAALKKQGATVIVQIGHVGYEEPSVSKYAGDQTIAREVPGIDLIVGGHSHTFLKKAYRDEKNGTLVVQAGSYLYAAGRTTLTIDPKTKKVTASADELVDLYPDQTGEDPEVAKVVAAEEAKVSAVYDVVIATAAESLHRDRNRESPMGDWMSDCLRSFKPGSDLGIQNGGGIRADIAKGPVTLRHIFNIMPFDNSVVRLEMDGGLVRETLDHGVGKTKGLVQQSGATFKYDREAPSGKRLRELEIGGKPIDPRKTYTVATLDFLVKGGDGFSPFARASKTDRTRVLMRDALAECARAQGVIKAPEGGRMIPQEPK